MKWLENPFHRTATEAEDLSYPPSGGWIKMVGFGFILPAVIIHFGYQAWITEEAIWFSDRNSTDLKVKGRTSQAMAVVYASVGLFCHFRWFWGLIPVYRAFEIGTTISLLGVLGGIGFAMYYFLTLQ